MQIDYKNRIFGLDVMRATAILAVVFCHTMWIFPEAQGSFASFIRSLGVLGVEIFFVLSGFLIGRILFRIFTNENFKTRDLYYFLIRRWFRTLPNYYLVLLINIGIAFYIGSELPETLILYFVFLQNAIFGMDLFFTEAWSLPVEEFAYIIGPLLFYLVLLPKFKISRKKLFLYVTLFIILFFSVTKIGYHFQTESFDLTQWNIDLKAVVLYRIDAIYYGVLAAYIALTKPKWWVKHSAVLLLLGIVLFIGVFSFIALEVFSEIDKSFFWNVLYLPLLSISIALSLPHVSQMKTAPTIILKPITYISVISYAMYLLHYSIILQLMRYFLPIEELSFSNKLVFAASYLFLTLFLSYFLYRWYEKPMMDLRDNPNFSKQFQNK